jgi:cephalosporin-C deacetylase-like acetyl esterase
MHYALCRMCCGAMLLHGPVGTGRAPTGGAHTQTPHTAHSTHYIYDARDTMIWYTVYGDAYSIYNIISY